jgi:demethylmenaquinone methyltransferase/2-methoxy-6-polyprenyl-1,4-benzoquinol methylase
MDERAVKRKSRWNAVIYDGLVARPTEALRREAVARLALRPGDRVVDLGCGTGLSLPLLWEAVGESGVIYGAELSPDMLARARERIDAAARRNVRLLEVNAELLQLPEAVHGILCFFTHDILLSPAALPRAMGFLAPGGRVVAAGVKLAHGWRGWILNPLTVACSLPAVTTRDVRRSFRPYARLEELVDEFRVEERGMGSLYLAWGRRAAASVASSAS